MRFFKGLCNIVLRFRYFVVAFWLVAAVVLYFTAPSLSAVVKSDAASFFSNSSETMKASNLYKELFPDEGNRTSFTLALEDKSGLNEADRQYAVALEKAGLPRTKASTS